MRARGRRSSRDYPFRPKVRPPGGQYGNQTKPYSQLMVGLTPANQDGRSTGATTFNSLANSVTAMLHTAEITGIKGLPAGGRRDRLSTAGAVEEQAVYRLCPALNPVRACDLIRGAGGLGRWLDVLAETRRADRTEIHTVWLRPHSRRTWAEIVQFVERLRTRAGLGDPTLFEAAYPGAKLQHSVWLDPKPRIIVDDPKIEHVEGVEFVHSP